MNTKSQLPTLLSCCLFVLLAACGSENIIVSSENNTGLNAGSEQTENTDNPASSPVDGESGSASGDSPTVTTSETQAVATNETAATPGTETADTSGNETTDASDTETPDASDTETPDTSGTVTPDTAGAEAPGDTTGSEPTDDNTDQNTVAQTPEEETENEIVMLNEDEYPGSRTEMALTWNASVVTFPDGAGGFTRTDISALENGTVSSSEPLPVAIYLHGCDGFWSGSIFRMEWLARQGFVTIAPDSFARSFYPQSCDTSTRTGWQYKPTISMRQFDAGYALEQVRQFSWVDQQNIIIYGFSEGGVIAATFNSSNPQHKVSSRVIEGWTCVSIPWEEYQGIRSPETEPVLTLLADRDPWINGADLPLSCGDFISQSNGSQSILVDYEPLRNRHALLEDSAIQEIILNFLLQQQAQSPVIDQ